MLELRHFRVRCLGQQGIFESMYRKLLVHEISKESGLLTSSEKAKNH
jgi:hypothetical protein